MKRTKIPVFVFPGLYILLIFHACMTKEPNSVLVVTGGHGYDTVEFVEMFDAMESIEYEMVLKPDAWAILNRDNDFDVLVFYDMWDEINDEEKKIFLAQFEKGRGMVFLHHSLASHQAWPLYPELVGGKYIISGRYADSSNLSGFRHDIRLQVRITDPGHPVTKGFEEFEILDEGYSHIFVAPSVHTLLEADHPDCSRQIGWTHQYANSKVVYLMGGHDRHAYENDSFRRLVENAIRWTAGKSH